MSRAAWLALLFSVLVAAAVWYGVARPRALALEWHGPLKSASFAPFRDGQSPLEEIFPTAREIEDDLLRLKGVFEGLRTYSATRGMDVVPALAAKHGFALTHSAWLGRGAPDNEGELKALIATANRYPDAVKRVIVGNEVLLRGDLKPEQLIAYLDRVRAAIRQPVSYADVWAFWLKYPQLAAHVDFITIHVLPYWEDEPVAVADAPAHLLAQIERIRKAFPGKPILVGETGWPTEGRSRGPAQASTLAAAHYVRALPALAAQHGFDYNLVEAYDQTWKARLEGTVGARWGLFDAERRQKYGLAGPVWPLPNAGLRATAAIVLGALFALVLVPLARSAAAAAALALCAQWLAAGVVESVYHALRLMIAPASLTWVLRRLVHALYSRGFASPVLDALYVPLLHDVVGPLAQLWGWTIALFAVGFTFVFLRWARSLLAGAVDRRAARLARTGFALYAVSMLVFALMFATAGRYMDIPLPHAILPLGAAFTLLCVAQLQPDASPQRCALSPTGNRFGRCAGWLLPLAALGCIWGEVGAMRGGLDFVAMHPTLHEQVPLIAGSILSNCELLLWCAANLLLGAGYGWSIRVARRSPAVAE
jgi:exo-beta-1,3-glucanase (GH17 family)